MRLHAAGFKSVYHDEPLAYLVAPESLHQYLTQRLRWGQGSMQILRQENPLFRKGLSAAQRLVYFMALSSFAQAVVHLAYYLAPPLYLLTGLAPLRASTPLQLLPIVAHVVVDVFMFRWFLGPLARPLLAEAYKFLNVYAYLKAIGGYFTRGRLKFEVTTKGRDAGASLRLLAPQLLLFTVNVTAFGVGIIRLSLDPPTFEGLWGTLVALGFCGLFVVIGAMALWFAIDRISSKADFTFPDSAPATLFEPESSALMVRGNEAEVHLLLPGKVDVLAGQLVNFEVDLNDAAKPLRLRGRVRRAADVRAASEPQGATQLQLLMVELEAPDTDAKDRLFDRFALRAMPRLVDPLVRRWRDPTEPLFSDGPEYFLPLQNNVL